MFIQSRMVGSKSHNIRMVMCAVRNLSRTGHSRSLKVAEIYGVLS